MEFAICHTALASLRAHPSDKSEMVSQLLFGEVAEVHERKEGWRRVVCAWDGVEGWTDDKQLRCIPADEYERYRSDYAVSLSLVEGLRASDHFIPLTLGAVLPCYDGLRCQLGNQQYQFSGSVVTPGDIRPSGEWISKLAKRYLYAPYLWGGRSPFGIDCSGLTQMVYKMAGIPLLRNARQQVMQGRSVDFTEQCQAGDLAFFDNGKGDIVHVGLVLADCNILHASGSVRVDRVDHFGIFNTETNRYTHQLRVIKRLLPDEAANEKMAGRPRYSDSVSAVSDALLFE